MLGQIPCPRGSPVIGSRIPSVCPWVPLVLEQVSCPRGGPHRDREQPRSTKPQIKTSLPFFYKIRCSPNLDSRRVFAIGSQYLGCRGSQPNHASNPAQRSFNHISFPGPANAYKAVIGQPLTYGTLSYHAPLVIMSPWLPRPRRRPAAHARHP